jgi:hypothetical protein
MTYPAPTSSGVFDVLLEFLSIQPLVIYEKRPDRQRRNLEMPGRVFLGLD